MKTAGAREPSASELERLPQTSVRLHEVRQMLSLSLLAPSVLGLGYFLRRRSDQPDKGSTRAQTAHYHAESR
jgi:hypothetical protein